jgi:UDP-N-acetylglucosamine--N-acetylmuramyl-(pentapeptide) pyrophosphoryl-undecaprenol N-acetylglucosamine transferase
VDGTRNAYARAGITAQVVSYIDDMPAAYRAADLAIVRSGASTISELAVVGLPALLVPWSGAARNHQQANACAFAERGAGLWADEQDWSAERVAGDLAAFLRDEAAWQQAADALGAMARPDAARFIARDLLEFAATERFDSFVRE